MKKLNDKVISLMRNAVSTVGSYNPSECFFIFEESLTIEESIYTEAFLRWVHDNNKTFGSGNINDVYSEFTRTKDFKKAAKEDSEFEGFDIEKVTLVEVEPSTRKKK